MTKFRVNFETLAVWKVRGLDLCMQKICIGCITICIDKMHKKVFVLTEFIFQEYQNQASISNCWLNFLNPVNPSKGRPLFKKTLTIIVLPPFSCESGKAREKCFPTRDHQYFQDYNLATNLNL